jgi:hypothetical protein
MGALHYLLIKTLVVLIIFSTITVEPLITDTLINEHLQ